VALVRRIDSLLSREGYSIRGVQRLLDAERGARRGRTDSLRAVRDSLQVALTEDG
jgi:arginine/ornithine N-succinyltransferase beta subunit